MRLMIVSNGSAVLQSYSILSCMHQNTNLHFMTFYGIPTHLVVWWPVAIRHFVLCHLMILFIIIVVPTFKYVTAIRVSHRRHKLLPSNSIVFYLIQIKYWKDSIIMFEIQFEYLVSFSTRKPILRRYKDIEHYSQSSISC